ncbi:acetoacetyl-CoA reductase [Paremcibacter congregatus]|uniref:acetoacetyl-CoA reductase n=1 Tax=Paremcibacter congregatus TaxID=2043170 RepID=UPI0030ECA3C2|tara:strand:+ start:317 stop:1042 length:726 start_codon:yes stop_codon:yes gene_type:complete
MSKVALVTGGTRGIGAAISLALKEAGYAVAATYAGNDTAAAEFKEATGIEVYKWDVGDFDACAEGVARVTQDLGEVAVLVNNAGITRDTGFSRMTKDMWDAVLDTNLTSNFNMCKATFDSMKAAKFGRIVCISSINGQKGQIGQVNYSAAKAGTIGFVKALAQEGARHGITVNAVAPGYIATEMVKAVPEDILAKIVKGIPVGRLGEAEEIADAVAYLVSDKASFITGSTLTINGGQYLTS